MKKYKDIAECLEPHKFHLVEDECLKEVRSKGRIITSKSKAVSTSLHLEETELPIDPNIVDRTDRTSLVCVSPPSIVEDVSVSSVTDSTILVDKTPNWTLIHSTLHSGGFVETSFGDEEAREEEEAVVVESDNNNIEEKNTVEVETQINNMDVETEYNIDVENNTVDAETERNNVEIEMSPSEDLPVDPVDTQPSSSPPSQHQREGPGLTSHTEKFPSSTPVGPSSPNQVRPNCKCEGCLRPNDSTCKTCKEISQLACNTATRGLRCEGRTCWGFSVPQVSLKMCQIRLERLRHQPGTSTTLTLNNNQEIADKEEESFENLVEIIEDTTVPIGSDEELLSVKVITQPASQPESSKKKTSKMRYLLNDVAVVPEPKKLIEFDIFSSIDKVLERKMESDQCGKLKRIKKIKERNTKKSRKVAHHSGEKEKSEPKTKKSRKVVYHIASGENEVKLNVSLHCIYFLTQDIGQEVTRMIEEEMKNNSLSQGD